MAAYNQSSSEQDVLRVYSNTSTPGTTHVLSSQNDCQDDDYKNNCQYKKQTACLVAGGLLIAACASKLDVGAPCISESILNVHINRVEHTTLFTNDMRNVSKELIQLAHRLFDLTNLSFSLDDQVLLVIDFILLREPWFFHGL